MPAIAGATTKPLDPHPLDLVPAGLTGAVCAIGNFDGVHRGHSVLFETARAEALARGVPAIVLTCEPHPRSVFRPESPVFRLAPLEVKARLFAAIGMDGLVVIPFDKEFAAKTAEAFIEADIAGRLSVKAAIIGYDFHFGRGRKGSPEYLAAAGTRLGFDTRIVEKVSDTTGSISSSRVRAHLEAGEIGEANALLGYRWFVVGEVVSGDRRGRTLGFPTANLRLATDCRLRHGIYAVRLRRADGSIHDGVASYGRRPTFDNGPPVLETHLLDFSGDLYGENVRITLVGWIRPELRFESVEGLVAEMTRDREIARRLLAESSDATALDLALDMIA